MNKPVSMWILAFLITASSIVYQRMVGPTYPLRGKTELNGQAVKYKLERSHGGLTEHRISIEIPDSTITGMVEWRRFNTQDTLTRIPMVYADGALMADLPAQPKAGKLQYRVILKDSEKEISLPESGRIADGIKRFFITVFESREPDQSFTVIRWKGLVPDWLVLCHVLLMIAAMLYSTRAGLEFFRKEPDTRTLSLLTVIFLVGGGFIFGPIVQYYAFDAFWTGWPYGKDLTDNKTLIALIGWVVALVAAHKSKRPGTWALIAAIINLIVYLIPHSILGSEFKYDSPQ